MTLLFLLLCHLLREIEAFQKMTINLLIQILPHLGYPSIHTNGQNHKNHFLQIIHQFFPSVEQVFCVFNYEGHSFCWSCRWSFRKSISNFIFSQERNSAHVNRINIYQFSEGTKNNNRSVVHFTLPIFCRVYKIQCESYVCDSVKRIEKLLLALGCVRKLRLATHLTLIVVSFYWFWISKTFQNH